MKKLALFVILAVMTAVSFGQSWGYKPVYNAPDTNHKIVSPLYQGDVVKVYSTGYEYIVKSTVGAGNTVGYVIRGLSRVKYPTWGTVGNLTATGNATIGGTLAVTDAVTFSSTLGVTGATTLASATPLVFSSQAITKGLNFNSAHMVASSANALFSHGTWSTPVYLKTATLAGHYVPFQVNLHVSTSGAYDVAGLRVRVDNDADTSATATFINGYEGRSLFSGGTIAGHAGINMSSNLSTGTTTTCTGDFIPILAKIEGAGNVSSSNHVTALMATVTATGTGVQDVAYISPNGSSVSTTLNLETVNSATSTDMLKIANTSGTVTNGIEITGTMTNAINLNGTTGVIYGNAQTADTAHFGTDASGARDKYIRKKITGVKATDVFVVSKINATNVAVTGGEVLGYYCTTDSLVISRSAATTAGLAVSWIRIKK